MSGNQDPAYGSTKNLVEGDSRSPALGIMTCVEVVGRPKIITLTCCESECLDDALAGTSADMPGSSKRLQPPCQSAVGWPVDAAVAACRGPLRRSLNGSGGVSRGSGRGEVVLPDMFNSRGSQCEVSGLSPGAARGVSREAAWNLTYPAFQEDDRRQAPPGLWALRNKLKMKRNAVTADLSEAFQFGTSARDSINSTASDVGPLPGNVRDGVSSTRTKPVPPGLSNACPSASFPRSRLPTIIPDHLDSIPAGIHSTPKALDNLGAFPPQQSGLWNMLVALRSRRHAQNMDAASEKNIGLAGLRGRGGGVAFSQLPHQKSLGLRRDRKIGGKYLSSPPGIERVEEVEEDVGAPASVTGEFGKKVWRGADVKRSLGSLRTSSVLGVETSAVTLACNNSARHPSAAVLLANLVSSKSAVKKARPEPSPSSSKSINSSRRAVRFAG
ncbi:hypothetical protein CEUSTIGMA_g9870.t1 [Chlamydomonas eustigma]|uniref:Uncharacterized protein n=1 Tax=Chlamydomonas eustigma TaxID=1157962 RepID=A0A250XHN9_9CHLO|nr:hypothetical protein CEUSTIGMA_g9870.t1 [Chlamydomonas eustigma]|eukprot:GAX82442.1 hypothetical protein CEUSTIGMA_g9870.t1 [Chlamydomonas eustigma]